MAVVVGIDIAKLKFDVALMLGDKFKTKVFSNSPKGFSELLQWAHKYTNESFHICMEATGVYGQALAEYLYGNDIVVSVVNPAQIKAFGDCQLARNKTDKADAKLIAQFCQSMQPKSWTPQPQEIQTLRALVKRLDELNKMHQQEYNRHITAPKATQKSIKLLLKNIKKNIDVVKNDIKAHFEKHPNIKANKKLLETIPGIGETTSTLILALVGDINQFQSAKQLAAFAGVTPKQRLSGSSIKGKSMISKMGKSDIRKALFLPAMVAKQYNPIIKAFCQRLIDNGKSKMQAITAAMRKLLHIIFGVLKSAKPFEPNFELNMA